MPIDEIAGEFLVEVGARAGVAAVDLVSGFVFDKRTLRYFHGIGRRVIVAVTLGRVRIPTSVRHVPKGTTPRPRRSDWVALWVGIGLWLTCAGLALAALILW